jgi:predicted metal-binding membrane protein
MTVIGWMTRPRPTARFELRWVVGAAWLLAAGAELTGRGSLLNHDQLIHGSLPRAVALVLFLVTWGVMVAAMMLPSALPLIRLFERASVAQPRARAARMAFVAAYVVVWTGFGGAAFLFDTVVHATVDASPWLLAHASVIAGGTLIVAGLFQLSPLKEACLRQCRNPGAFLLRYYRRGVGRAFATGAWHGVFCLGCCWALMLVAFALGMANLVWMAGLTLLMTLEKRWAHGPLLARVSGVWLALVGLVVVAQPLWGGA